MDPTLNAASSLVYETYLLGLPRFVTDGRAAMRPGLCTMKVLMDAMGRPDESFESVHVAGTNGKGTTCSLLAAISTASGRRTGLHTSPHLNYVRERLRIDGVPAPDEWLEQSVRRWRATLNETRASFFEATTALSFLYFAESGVDLAIIETGLGGRLDATNILFPRLSIITSVNYDHTDILGQSLTSIATEKSGIIKAAVPVLTATAGSEVLSVLRDAAAAHGAPLHVIDPDSLPLRTPVREYEDLYVDLRGAHNRGNVLLAVRAAELLFPDVRSDPAAVFSGLRRVRKLSGIRGRLDLLNGRRETFVDVAHNPAALKAVLEYVDQRGVQLFVVFGALRDKDLNGMAQALSEAKARVFICRLPTRRAATPEEIAVVLNRHGVRVWGQGSVSDGVAGLRRIAGSEDVCLVTGSHLVVAAALYSVENGE